MVEIQEIPLDKINVGDHVLRMEAEDESLFSLVASIRRIGVLVPLVCRREGEELCLVAGHRRLAAAKKAGLGTVPVVVGEYDNAQSSEVSLAENLFRADLTPVEVAAGMKDILDEGIMEPPDLAAAMHRSEHWVHAQISMLVWPADVLELVHRGKISVSAASNLALITDDDYRTFLLKNAEDNGATARITAAWLQAWRAAMPQQAAVEQPPLEGREMVKPALPQAPCLVCNQVFRTDGLAMVLVCPGCVNAVRGVGAGR